MNNGNGNSNVEEPLSDWRVFPNLVRNFAAAAAALEPQPGVGPEEKDGEEDEEPQPPVGGEGEDLRPESPRARERRIRARRVRGEVSFDMLQRKGQELTALVVDIAYFDFETFKLLQTELEKLIQFHAREGRVV